MSASRGKRPASKVKVRKARRPRQESLVFRSWGGRRKGAGRKPKGRRAEASHDRRAEVDPRFPLHITLKVRHDVPHLRRKRFFKAIEGVFFVAKRRLGLRLLHFTVQGNHIHLIVEAEDKTSLSRGMQGLCIRLAKAINKACGRKGKVFADRFFARPLRTPSEVRNALCYLLNNTRRHMPKDIRVIFPPRWVDPFSSGRFFDGWRDRPPDVAVGQAEERAEERAKEGGEEGAEEQDQGPKLPVTSAKTWLASTGWRRLGLLDVESTPGPRGSGGRCGGVRNPG